MKIGYILPNYCLIDGSSGGVFVQARDWARLVRLGGNDVVEIKVWEDYDWKTFDVIHFFYYGFPFEILYRFLKQKAVNAKFTCSPILDPHEPIWVYKVLSYLAIPKIKFWNEFSLLRYFSKFFDLFLARTEFEKEYLIKAFGISRDKIKIIPLNSRLSSSVVPHNKKKFCLHVSRIFDPTKNVERLVDAALKYNFELVLAGSSTAEFDNKLRNKIGDNKNITLLGRVSDERLIELYSEAKVFALPSTREGVGLVALEAASYGCDIVITNIGGPKEYFLPNAIAVDPYSVDDIGKAIRRFLDGDTYQPMLQKMITEKYSEEKVKNRLLKVYKEVENKY